MLEERERGVRARVWYAGVRERGKQNQGRDTCVKPRVSQGEKKQEEGNPHKRKEAKAKNVQKKNDQKCGVGTSHDVAEGNRFAAFFRLGWRCLGRWRKDAREGRHGDRDDEGSHDVAGKHGQ